MSDDPRRIIIIAMHELLSGEEYVPEPCFVGKDHQVHKTGSDHSEVKLEFPDTLDAGMWASNHPCAVVMCIPCFGEEDDPERPRWERGRAIVRASLN